MLRDWLMPAFIAVIAIGVPWLIVFHVRDRAAAHDHTAAVGRDFAVPLRCANCWAQDAPFVFPVSLRAVGDGRLVNRWTAQSRPRYDFHFCLRCARPVRARRRLGAWIIAAAALSALSSVPILMLVHGLDLFTISVFAAPMLLLAGLSLRASPKAVTIWDTGEEKLYFRFRSQNVRDRFAELNGAP